MIYKFDNGGTIKLQNAGSVPEYNDIEQIAKYNREHGTNFWKMSQVLEHDKQQAQQKTQDEKKSFWKILAGHPESAGEAILNKTIETANNAELPETRKKIYNDTAKSELGTTAGSLLTLPMLGEFSTYGLLGGASRIAGGMTGSAVGSYTLGKAGELGDRTFGTTWMKPAGQIIGGFAGWPAGSNIAWRGAAKIAPNRIIGDFVSGSLNKNISNAKLGISDLQRNIEAGKIGWAPATTETLYHHADKHLTELDPMFKSWDVVNRDAPLGKVWLTKDNGKRIRLYRAQKKDAVFDPKSAENGVEQEQFAGKWFTPDTEKPKRYALNASKRNTPTELQYVDIPEDQLSMFEAKRIVPSYFDYEPEDFIIPFTYKRGTVPISDRTISIFGNDYENALKIAKSANPIDFTASRPFHYQTILKLNKPMVQLNEAVGTGKNATRNQVVRFAQDSGADGIQFKNILDNGLSHQNQTTAFKPVTLGEITPTRPTFIPQKSVSTVHFDPRVKPLSRPVSEAERLGIIKADRQMYDMFPKIQENAIRFAKEYGYPEPKTLSEIKDMYRRHNTFFRTVSIPSREWNQSIGDDFWKLSKEEQLKILASKGYPREMREYVEEVNPNGPTFQDQFVFVSPTLEENASYFINGKLDNTVKLQRPFSFNRPSQWHIDADWRPIEQSPQELWPKGKVGIGNTTPEREVKVSTKHLIPIDIAKQSDLGTRNGEYLVERINQASHLPFYDRPNWLKYNGWNWEIDYPSISPRYKQGGTLKAQRGTGLAGIPILKNLAKKGFELVAKRSNGAQTKSIPTIIGDIITGRDKSFYNINNSNGSNEINTYLYGKPYNSEFTGDASIGPDYTNYINKNYPNKNIKTYNTHFGDTLYIDDKAKSLVEKQLNTGEVVGGSMGRYAHAPSYIVTTEEGRPYDAGGHLIKFSKDENGNIVANMSDIYDFLPEDFNDKYDQTENPSWTRNFANNIGTPFIVRQNNIPVVFKEIVPEYKTEKQKELGDFLSQWGNTYDLKLPLKLSDEQIDEIFDGRDYGDDILDFMISKGYIKPVYKQGGVLKTQK